jgi:hypothetical protein
MTPSPNWYFDELKIPEMTPSPIYHGGLAFFYKLLLLSNESRSCESSKRIVLAMWSVLFRVTFHKKKGYSVIRVVSAITGLVTSWLVPLTLHNWPEFRMSEMILHPHTTLPALVIWNHEMLFPPFALYHFHPPPLTKKRNQKLENTQGQRRLASVNPHIISFLK